MSGDITRRDVIKLGAAATLTSLRVPDVLAATAGAPAFFTAHEFALVDELSEMIIPPEYRNAHQSGLRRFLTTEEGPVLGKRLELLPLNLAASPDQLLAEISGLARRIVGQAA